MTRLRVWIARLGETFRTRRLDRDLDAELRAHLDLSTEEYIRRGLTRAHAEAAARRDLGGVTRTMEEVHDRRGVPGLGAVARDVRYGLRLLRRSPGFTLSAVLTLALAFGANTAIFSLADAALFRPLPYADSGRLVSIWEVIGGPTAAPSRSAVAAANYVDYVARTRHFERFAAYSRSARTVSGDGAPERIVNEFVTASYFDVLDVWPAMGRPFRPDEESVNARVAIVSYGVWQRRFGGRADVLGRILEIDGEPYQIVGVMPRAFRAVTDAGLADATGLWLPKVFRPDELANRHDHEHRVIARLRPGASVDAARADLAAVSDALAREFPDMATVRTALAPLAGDQTDSVRPLFALVLGGVGFVMLIACVNVAGLLVVRSLARRRELAVRLALGASRPRLAAELITHSLVLAVLGGAAGLALGWLMLTALLSVAPASVAGFQPVTIDLRVVVFSAVLTTVTGLVFGLLPLRQVTRLQPTDVLRATDRAVVGRWRLEGRGILVVVEVALGTVLLVGAGLMIRSLAIVNDVPLGFDPAQVVAVNVTLPPRLYATPRARLDFFEQLATRAAALPGVTAVTFANRLPLRGNWSSGILFDPASGLAAASAPARAGLQAVSPGYFDTLRVPLVRGRLLQETDRSGAPAVGVVSEAFGATLAGRDPVGLRIRRAPEFPAITIVGVVADIRRGGRTADVEPQVYLPAAQIELYPLPLSDLAIRYSAGAPPSAAAIAGLVTAIDPRQPISNVRTLEETLGLLAGPRRFQTMLFGLFAAVALALAAIGIYGVVAYAVGQRAPEIGLRIALGADRRRLLQWVLAQGGRLIAAGVAIGLTGAYLLSDLVQSLVFGVSPTDPVVYAAAAGVLALAAFAATAVAGRRATHVDPISVLR